MTYTVTMCRQSRFPVLLATMVNLIDAGEEAAVSSLCRADPFKKPALFALPSLLAQSGALRDSSPPLLRQAFISCHFCRTREN